MRVGPDGAVVELSPAREADLWINGGFFVFRPEVFEHMHEGEDLVDEPFDRLIKLGQLRAQRYDGFWAAMDTMKDKVAFDETEASGRAPWMVWKRVLRAWNMPRIQRGLLRPRPVEATSPMIIGLLGASRVISR